MYVSCLGNEDSGKTKSVSEEDGGDGGKAKPLVG